MLFVYDILIFHANYFNFLAMEPEDTNLTLAAGRCAPVRDILLPNLKVSTDLVADGYECYEMTISGLDDIQYIPRWVYM